METIGDGIISEIKPYKKDLYNCSCNTQKELEKQKYLLVEALEMARDEIKFLLVDAGVVFLDQQETLCRIDAAIAAARGTV